MLLLPLKSLSLLLRTSRSILFRSCAVMESSEPGSSSSIMSSDCIGELKFWSGLFKALGISIRRGVSFLRLFAGPPPADCDEPDELQLSPPLLPWLDKSMPIFTVILLLWLLDIKLELLLTELRWLGVAEADISTVLFETSSSFTELLLEPWPEMSLEGEPNPLICSDSAARRRDCSLSWWMLTYRNRKILTNNGLVIKTQVFRSIATSNKDSWK